MGPGKAEARGKGLAAWLRRDDDRADPGANNWADLPLSDSWEGEGLRFRRLRCPASLPETLVKAGVERRFISSAPRDRVEQAKNAWEEIYPDSPRPFRCYSR